MRRRTERASRDEPVANSVFRLVGEIGGRRRAFVLESGEQSVGSSKDNDLWLAVPEVSRNHCLIRVDSGGVFLEDLKSTNGTFVNGVRIRNARLKEDDWVQFGPALLSLESVPVDELEMAIRLDGVDLGTSSRADLDRADESTQLDLPRAVPTSWPGIVSALVRLLFDGPDPDLEGALTAFVDGLGGGSAAFLERDSAGGVLTRALVGRATDLIWAREADVVEALLESDEDGDRVIGSGCSDSGENRLAAARLGHDGWETALVASGAGLNSSCRPLSEIALRLVTASLSGLGGRHPTVSWEHPELVFPSHHVVGRSPAARRLYQQIGSLLFGDGPILISGETGVGKEHVAHIFHASSDRRNGPLQVVNCAAIPADLLEAELFGIEAGVATGVSLRAGKFQLAHRGILFFDEIGEMALPLQAKLLRALQEGQVHPLGAQAPVEVDVRVLAVTNSDLEEKMQRDAFRRDLFYRIAGCEVRVPPLRDRREDIPALVRHFLERFSTEMGKRISGVSLRALDVLQQAAWPGNVREFEHEMRRLVSVCPIETTIEGSMISKRVAVGVENDSHEDGPEEDNLDLKHRLRELERGLIDRALDLSGGNVAEAARRLNTTRNGLVMKMQRLGVKRR
ncbi:MAG: sigma 54-interacting transcriptional regulator [Thermoanaerobaculales bacterium]